MDFINLIKEFNMEKEKRKFNKNEGHDVKLSKALSYLLRHGAIEEGLKMDAAGYVKLDDVMKYLKEKKGYKGLHFKDIQAVVDTNDKKRFELNEEGKHICIRATQGHSIKEVSSEQLLKLIEDPEQFPTVIHGTYTKFWKLIKEQGLKKMARNHIHFAPGMPKEEGVISGMRGTCDIYIEIDMFAAIKDGIKFYVSSNNVILTEGVDGALSPKYFKKVIRKNGEQL